MALTKKQRKILEDERSELMIEILDSESGYKIYLLVIAIVILFLILVEGFSFLTLGVGTIWFIFLGVIGRISLWRNAKKEKRIKEIQFTLAGK